MIPLIVGAGLLLLIGTPVVLVHLTTERRAKEIAERIETLLAETEARPAGRPALRGEALPGNAWDDYAKALRAAG